MRVLFATQSASLRLFDAMRAAIDQRLGIERAGFIIADSSAYGRWLEEKPDFERRGHYLLKEWEVTARRTEKPDLAALARFEREIGGDAGLFGALVADRRLFMGPDCTYSQDYRRRFTDDELLAILQNGLEETGKLFDELKPDLVVGFICVTMLDYLAYLFARARGVRVLNLRPARVGDRVGLNSTLNDPAPEFTAACARIRDGASSPHLEDARRYLRRVREQHGRYEGVVRPSEQPALKVNPARKSFLAAALGTLRNYARYRNSVAARDNHVPDPLRALFFALFVNPARARAARRLLGPKYVTREELKSLRFAFFPLHTEPEVSLLVYARPFLNQIELVRSVAMSLPVDMVLILKEHPWMVGKRTLGAYRKLLNIPRVRFANPGIEARDLILGAQLLTVITGSTALEAAILGKPVITFGDCPYNALPVTMVRRCADLRRLPQTIREMLENYRMDERALEAYLAAVMETSTSANLYSVLLGKRNVHTERAADYDREISGLADYLVGLLRGPAAVAGSARGELW